MEQGCFTSNFFKLYLIRQQQTEQGCFKSNFFKLYLIHQQQTEQGCFKSNFFKLYLVTYSRDPSLKQKSFALTSQPTRFLW